ncbi:MAG TPA: hypothetical protein VF081_08875 [Solirubrobacterales bacterium]
MNGRRTVVGFCMLCALLVSAFAAQSASAITGTTAFTCSKEAAIKDRVGEHCLNIEGSKEYGHVAIAENTTTEVTATNEKTEANTTKARLFTLRITIGGVPLAIHATGVSGSGWMTNAVNPATKEHYAHGEGTVTFTGVTITEPAGRGCKVYTHKEDGSGNPGEEGAEGIVHTRLLKATTEGQGDNVKFTAADNGNFVNFWITCEVPLPAIEGTWSCSGSVKGQPNGATIEFTHATVTAENTLKCRGAKAGIDGASTLSGKDPKIAGDTFKPLAGTTVTT